jgi:hypothetical protein
MHCWGRNTQCDRGLWRWVIDRLTVVMLPPKIPPIRATANLRGLYL